MIGIPTKGGPMAPTTPLIIPIDGRTPEVTAADNLRTFAAVLAIARSIDERRPVKL